MCEMEHQLSLSETKLIKSEFEEMNTKLISSLQSKPLKRKFNLPRRTRDALKSLNKHVRDKVLDIRKVDKGQLILIIDYNQRKKIEEEGITRHDANFVN